jgi:hypothetical protein
MSVLTAVTEAETKVVDTVKSLKQPVVDYVSKGVEYAEGRVPKVTYPDVLPKPIDSQYDFVTSLISAQHELVKAVVETVSPLVGAGKAHRPAAKATKATKSAA